MRIRKKNIIWLKRVTLFLFALVSLAYLFNFLLLNSEIPQKSDGQFRIGYINLHEQKISPKDLQKMAKWDCDLWLFLEWNGDNLEKHLNFTSAYHLALNEPHKKTFGTLVLTKDSALKVQTISKPNYTCNYRKHLFKFNGKSLFLVHAPPPVPSCNYETEKYIQDLIKETEKEQNPIIIGDLNQAPFQNGVQLIENKGFQYYGKSITPSLGLGTWLPKIVKVDYLFTKNTGQIKNQYWFTISSSDHTGFVVDME